MAEFMEILTSLKGYTTTLKFLSDIPTALELAEKYTLSDLKNRIPPIVSKEVRQVYNIQKKDVKPSALRTGLISTDPKIRSAGRLRINGTSLLTLRFDYTGRLLTPAHFAMNPTSASMNPHTPYVITMRVMKNRGSQKIGQHLGNPPVTRNPYYPRSGYILFPTGAKSEEKTSHIPIQRMKPGHRPSGSDAYKKFTTVSMPQMVSSEYTREGIQARVGALVQKRFEHQLSRVAGL